MNTINQERPTRMGVYAQPSIMEWLKANIYLGHAATLASIMAIVEDLCKQTRTNVAFITVDVAEMYAATIHHRGLRIMKISIKDAPRDVIGMIALLTAIPDGGGREYIIAGRLIQPTAELDTKKLRGIGTDPISEGGGVDWDELRLWLTFSSFGNDGERLRKKIESYLIDKQLTNLPLRFRQGGYRRKARYSQSGCIAIDVVLPPDGDRLATIRIRTKRTEEPARREYLDTDGFSFEFNPEAFTQPEEASNMQVQQATPENANMVQVGKGLDYLPMYTPIGEVLKFTHFVEWLKANMLETVVDDFDQYLTGLDIEAKFDGFRFKHVQHPPLEEVTKGEKVYGEIVFECLKDGEYSGHDLQFIIGAQEKADNVGYYEAIIGWPEDKPTAKAEKPAHQPEQPPRDQIRMSLFATNGNQRSTSGVRQLQAPKNTMQANEFAVWFNNNATNTNRLHLFERLKQLILDAPSVVDRAPDQERRFFINVAAHAQLAPAVVGKGDPSIAGYLDVVVVEEVKNRPGEFRQTGLFNFTTAAKSVPNVGEVAEYIDAYIHPDHRGAVSVNIDPDQVYTFGQLADLFKAYDPDGSHNLLQYQASVYNLLRRLYGKEVGPHLYMKAIRMAHPSLRGNGNIEPGKITVKVFNQYVSIDQDTPLVTFDLITGLGSDTFNDRNVELIQSVECQAADELKARTEAAREQARVETLETIGAAPGHAKEANEQAVVGKQPKDSLGMGVTKFQSDSFEFFKGTLMGVLPLLSTADLADRVNNTIEFMDRTYHGTATGATFEFTFVDGVELVIDAKEPNGNYTYFGIKL
jgi:hypothetical protein